MASLIFFIRFAIDFYWFPNPFWSPQSGHCQVMPLQDNPHRFSSMHSWHMLKPQRQLQKNGKSLRQQWQLLERLRRLLSLYPVFTEVFFMNLVVCPL
jgi:hypothetical protein